MKTALVLGAGGFIGSHLVKRLKADQREVIGVDLKRPEFSETAADHFLVGDLRDPRFVGGLFVRYYDEVYQLAADMGGAGYVFIGENDSHIMHNSALINLNVLDRKHLYRIKRIFFSSSACVYPQRNQTDPDNPNCAEDSAYPADPDSEYGWEKLFSERLYQSLHRTHGLEVRIARYHNIYGPDGVYAGGREKAPAALCRKVAEATDGGEIEIWGDGEQTRSFLYVQDCIAGTLRLMRSCHTGPFNIGSEEMVSINTLADMIIAISGKQITKKHVPGPQGVRGRTSDNSMIRDLLSWNPSRALLFGLEKTYRWIESRIKPA